MAKYTKYRVAITDSAFPNGEYVITRKSLHNDYLYVWLVWPYVHIGKYPPSVGFSRDRDKAHATMRTISSIDAVRIVQEIQPGDRS